MRTVVATCVLAVAVASAATTFGQTWRFITDLRRAGAALTPAQREHAAGDALPLPMDRFDFYRRWLRDGDVYRLEVAPGGFSSFFDLPGVVGALGRFYLLPAVQTLDPARANVVLSWDTDPKLLGLRFTVNAREGQQVVFVSRIAGR